MNRCISEGLQAFTIRWGYLSMSEMLAELEDHYNRRGKDYLSSWKCLTACYVTMALLFASAALVSGQEERRTITPIDLKSLERVSGEALSPDGAAVAFERDLDVWVASTVNEKSRVIWPRHESGADRVQLKWSPDGQRLLIVAWGAAGPALYVWTSGTDTVRQVTTQELWTFDSVSVFAEWIDERRIISALRPPGEYASWGSFESASEYVASQEWIQARTEKNVTVSVLESSDSPFSAALTHTTLTLFDVESNGFSNCDVGDLIKVSLSPDRRHIAALSMIGDDHRTSSTAVLNQYSQALFQTTLVDIVNDNRLLPIWSHSIATTPPPIWARWSADGRAIAFRSLDPVKVGERGEWYSCSVSRDRCSVMRFPSNVGSVVDLIWTGSGEQLVRAVKTGKKRRQSADWWYVGKLGAITNLTSSIRQRGSSSDSDDFESILVENGWNSFVVQGGGSLWRIGLGTEYPIEVTRSLSARITNVTWREQADSVGFAESIGNSVVVSVVDKVGTHLCRVDLASGDSSMIEQPTARLMAIQYAEGARVTLFVTGSASQNLEKRTALGSGNYESWICKGETKRCYCLLRANTFLLEIDQDRQHRVLSYYAQDGRKATALLFLPVNYMRGHRYPLIVWVYAGATYPEQWGLGNEIDEMELLTAHNYAVLFPSMPLPPEGVPGDPYINMLKGVLPATNAAVQSGIADEHRLGIMGHSFGGYSVLSIIAQTNLFKAAVARAPLSDFISACYSFGFERYAPTSRDPSYGCIYGQNRMGKPPWLDAQRYVRNSPIFHAGQINTPVMIVQGDEDFVPMEQGEEIFNALRSQGKRAELIRYWGEHHDIERPQNNSDLWQRIYGWFDKYLVLQ